jgi:hypothetical protein
MTGPVTGRPGSAAEQLLQCTYGTEDRAARFYADQMRDRLLPRMVEFIGRMEMLFLSTADAQGSCDSSLRAGPPGFLRVLDERHVAYPEYRGNGVHASLANISENPHVGLLMLDFEHDLIGLHVNGRARILDDEIMRALHPAMALEVDAGVDAARGRRAERWVVVEVAEAYIHCRKHIPRMARVHQAREWGTDDPARKGGDYFGARSVAGSAPATAAGGGGVAPGVPLPTVSPEATVDQLDPPTAPLPIQAPVPEPASNVRPSGRTSRPRFPSTTHLPAGAATARPLRTATRTGWPPHAGQRRRIRWLSS